MTTTTVKKKRGKFSRECDTIIITRKEVATIKKEHIVNELILGEGANIIRGKSICDQTKAKAYREGVKLLEKLHEEHGGFSYKADDVDTPKYIHEIEVKWLEFETELSAKKMAEILASFDTMIFSKEKILADTWVLSSEIYKEA